jgi:type I restriction enzyme S subunit
MTKARCSTKTIEDCLERLLLPNLRKVNSSQYQNVGKYPIIDQGQRVIAGWTDDESGVISEPLPVIVFGDHTRTFKFADFPFVRGADGTQILKPKKGIDPLFFFYACRALDLPERGYNRHFSSLKEKTVRIPDDEEEQRRTALVLRELESTKERQEIVLGTLADLKLSAMNHLFRNGVLGIGTKETEFGFVPANYELRPISGLGAVVTGNTPPTKNRENYVGGTIPFVSPADIQHGFRIQGTGKHISETGLLSSRPLPQGTICFVCIGSTIGKVGQTTAPVTVTNQQINSIIPSGRYHPDYIFHLLTFWSEQIQREASPSPVPILTKGAFERIQIYASPDEDEQKKTAEVLNAIDIKTDLHLKKKVF